MASKMLTHTPVPPPPPPTRPHGRSAASPKKEYFSTFKSMRGDVSTLIAHTERPPLVGVALWPPSFRCVYRATAARALLWSPR